jgi:hypothetical protein
LARHLIWYPVKKYLHDNDTVTQLYDDIDSGKSWWDIQVSSVLVFSEDQAQFSSLEQTAM